MWVTTWSPTNFAGGAGSVCSALVNGHGNASTVCKWMRACVNPYHLEDVTRAVNVARIHTLQCRRGHTRTETNTRVRSDGYNQCLDCRSKTL